MLNISLFLKDLTEIEQLLIGGMEDATQSWYALNEKGDVDEAGARQRFLDVAEKCSKDFPLLKDTKARNTNFDPPNPGYALGSRFLFGGVQRRLDANHRIRAPLYLGESVTVHSFSKIIGPSVIGDRCELGSYVAFSRSFVRADVEIENYVELSDALVGRNVYLGPRATVCHKPGPKGEVTVSDRRNHALDPFTIRRRRVGSVIGDECYIGAGAILEPGVFLLPGCRVRSGVVVHSGIWAPGNLDLL